MYSFGDAFHTNNCISGKCSKEEKVEMKERFFASHFINKEKSVNFARLLRLRQYKNKTYHD